MTEIIPEDLFISLLHDGLIGNRKSFEMRVRRLVSKINKSDPKFAKKINLILADSSLRSMDQSVPSPVDSDTRQQLLNILESVTLKDEPVWSEKIAIEINRVCIERERSDSLLREGLLPTRSILMEGPPGVGKTLMAHYLAEKMNLPLLTLDLATVMSSYLGKTGSNIRAVLNYAKSFPCILFFDEFDSIAKKRDDESDVGELKRLVTVLLQAIDEWPTTSLLIAATNHGELLDRAVWRRFDKVITFELPTEEQIIKFFSINGLNDSLSNWLGSKIESLSFSAIEKRLNHAKKNAILENKLLVETVCMQFELDFKEYLALNKQEKHQWIKYLSEQGKSQMDIASIIGVSRSTVVRALEKNKG
ncbi:AAA family ATPase [Sulfurovum sp.]|uniref:AAA family ATPase n=1 Tax=Sulfurovum sp. TaxID=1969726 RepID=UPI0028680B7D|nr:AAA family ATPase [Sulfurovum sp.]